MNDQLDIKIAEYYSIRPSQFPVMKSITLKQGFDQATGEMQQQLSIVLAKDEKFVGEMVYLDLFGVRNLRLKQPDISLIDLSNVEINKSPPGSRFHQRFVVMDAEQDEVFVCSCHDFSIGIR